MLYLMLTWNNMNSVYLIQYVHIAALSVKLTWFGAEGFQRRPSRGWLWYCCYGSPCKYKNILLVRQSINMFLILCVYVCVRVWRKDRVCLWARGKSYVLMLHLPLHSWKTFLDKWDVNMHTYAVSVSHMHAAEHLLKLGGKMVCACVRICVYVQASGCVGV